MVDEMAKKKETSVVAELGMLDFGEKVLLWADGRGSWMVSRRDVC